MIAFYLYLWLDINGTMFWGLSDKLLGQLASLARSIANLEATIPLNLALMQTKESWSPVENPILLLA